MNAFTPIRPTPLLCTLSFAELVADYTAAELDFFAADVVLQANPGDKIEDARFGAAEDRMLAISDELRARLASHVGGKAVLARIMEIAQ